MSNSETLQGILFFFHSDVGWLILPVSVAAPVHITHLVEQWDKSCTMWPTWKRWQLWPHGFRTAARFKSLSQEAQGFLFLFCLCLL